MPYFPEISMFSSTLSFTTFALPIYFSATCSTFGASMRHGPHQGAQKSTNTGLSDCITSISQFESLTSPTNLLIAFSLSLFLFISLQSLLLHRPQYPVFQPGHYTKRIRLLAHGGGEWGVGNGYGDTVLSPTPHSPLPTHLFAATIW